MNKIKIKHKNENKENIIPMSEMKPGQIGVIVGDNDCEGHVVRHISHDDMFTVEDMTEGGCWIDQDVDLKVRLLPKAVIVVHIDGDGEE